MTAAVEARGLSCAARRHGGARSPRRDLTLVQGESLALRGPAHHSSDLLNLLGLLEAPGGGRLRLLGVDVLALPAPDRARFRLRHLGFLLPEADGPSTRPLLELLEQPLAVRGLRGPARRARASAWLVRLGLRRFAQARLDDLQPAQRARLDIARALVTHPSILLADEPTRGLSGMAARLALDDLLTLCRLQRCTCIVALGDPILAGHCHRTA